MIQTPIPNAESESSSDSDFGDGIAPGLPGCVCIIGDSQSQMHYWDISRRLWGHSSDMSSGATRAQDSAVPCQKSVPRFMAGNCRLRAYHWRSKWRSSMGAPKVSFTALFP